MPRKKPAADPLAFIFCPKTFDPAACPGLSPQMYDSARLYLSTIFIRRVMTAHRAKSPFVNLSQKRLGDILGNRNHVRPVREALLAAGLIEIDGEYRPGRKCLGHRLAEPLRGPGIWARYAMPGARFAKKAAKSRSSLVRPCPENPELTAHLQKWVDLVEFTPAADWVMATISDELFPPRPDGQEHEFLSRRDFAAAQRMVIESGHRPVKRDLYGRYHTAFTVLCRELRTCLKINSEPLWEIDVAASQPYLLGMLVLRNLQMGRQNKTDSGGFPLGRVYVSNFVPQELDRLFDRVLAGRFYDDFTKFRPGLSRDDVKRQVFCVIFGDVELMNDSRAGKRFKKLYPAVFAATVWMKEHNPLIADKKEEKPFAWVGRELQRMESRVVIDDVAETLRRDHPEIPFLTVHDSLLTPERHLPLIRSLLDEAFGRAYPFKPTLKVKGPTLDPAITSFRRRGPASLPAHV